MANITFKVDADTAKAVQGFLKLVDSQKKSTDESRKHARQSKASENQVTRDIRSMISGYLSLTGALQGLQRAYQMLREEQKREAEAASEAARATAAALGGAGLMAHANELIPYLRNLEPTMDQAEAAGILSAVAGGAPTASLQRQKALAGLAARGKRMGIPDLQRYATLMAEVGQLAPERPAGDVADIATFVTQASGRYEAKIGKAGVRILQQAIASGLSLEQAVAIMTASITAGQGPEGASAILQKLTGPSVPPGLRGMNLEKRLAAIKADPALASKIFGVSQTPAVLATLNKDIPGLEKQIRAAQEGDLQAQALAQYAAVPEFATQTQADAAAAARKNEDAKNIESLHRQAVYEAYMTVLKRREGSGFLHPGGPISRGISAGSYWTATTAFDMTPEQTVAQLEGGIGGRPGARSEAILAEIRDIIRAQNGNPSVPSPATHREP